MRCALKWIIDLDPESRCWCWWSSRHGAYAHTAMPACTGRVPPVRGRSGRVPMGTRGVVGAGVASACLNSGSTCAAPMIRRPSSSPHAPPQWQSTPQQIRRVLRKWPSPALALALTLTGQQHYHQMQMGPALQRTCQPFVVAVPVR